MKYRNFNKVNHYARQPLIATQQPYYPLPEANDERYLKWATFGVRVAHATITQPSRRHVTATEITQHEVPRRTHKGHFCIARICAVTSSLQSTTQCNSADRSAFWACGQISITLWLHILWRFITHHSTNQNCHYRLHVVITDCRKLESRKLCVLLLRVDK